MRTILVSDKDFKEKVDSVAVVKLDVTIVIKQLVNVGIGDSFPSQKADLYDVKIEQLFPKNFVLFIVLCQ